MLYDICIIGSGPAGAVLAMLLQNTDYKIAIIEKRDFDKEYDFRSHNLKSCGGLLAPDAQKQLSYLNLTLPNSVLANPQMFSVKTIDLESGLLRVYQRFYINMNREKFDRWLSEQATTTNIHKYYGSKVKNLNKINGNHKITFSKAGVEQSIEAKILIGAGGANSIVRSKYFQTKKTTRYASLQKVYQKVDIENHFLSIFDSSLTDYYGWGLTKGDYFYLGLATKNGDNANKKFTEMEVKLKKYGYKLGETIRSEGTVLIRPTSRVRLKASKDGSIYLIGEAGEYISPSSAEGISFAIGSAINMYNSIIKAQDISELKVIQKEYLKSNRKIALTILIKSIKRSLLYSPLLRKLIMLSRIEDISTKYNKLQKNN